MIPPRAQGTASDMFGGCVSVLNQIVVMNAGLVAQAGTPAQLYEEPQSEFVAGFMGEAMLFSAVADAQGRVTLGPLLLQPRRAVAAGPVKVAVRPEAWQIGAAGATGQAGSTSLAGTLLKRSYLGSVQELTVATALGEIFAVSPDVARTWRVGDGLSLTLAEKGVSIVAAG